MLRLREAGDTIVEVMIALAILGSAFGISYATANSALNRARNAEEHSQALQFLSKQLELLRLAAGNDDARTAGVFAQPGSFCLKATSPVQIQGFTDGWVPSDHTADDDDWGHYPDDCTESSKLYHLSIKYTAGSSSDLFQIMVRWDGVASLGRQQEFISYKLHP